MAYVLRQRGTPHGQAARRCPVGVGLAREDRGLPASLNLSHFEQNPRNSRRNALPTERIDWLLLMRHEHLTCALIELMQITQTPSRSDGVFHRPPEAFYGIEVVTTVGR